MNNSNTSINPNAIKSYPDLVPHFDKKRIDTPPVDAKQPPRPLRPAINPENIPTLLKELAQWSMWTYYLPRNGKKWSKLPLQVNGTPAKSSDPSTWNNFESCLAHIDDKPFPGSRRYTFDGLGFCLSDSDGLTGLDLDGCNSAAGLSEFALSVSDQFGNTYQEISPSGRGLRIWCLGRPRRSTTTDRIEIYAHPSHRMLTVTGQAINTCGINESQAALDWLFDTHFPTPPVVQKPAIRYESSVEADIEMVREAFTYLDPDSQYNEWIKHGFACFNSGIPLWVWDEWSSRGMKYIPGECDKKWRTF